MNGLKRLSERQHPHPSARRTWLRWAGAWLAIGAGGFAFAGDDAVYTWKDAAGRVHYGNRPPAGQAAEPVQLNTQPVSVQATEHIYTWTDAEGKIHYGARPPPTLPAKELKEEDSSLSTIRSTQIREGEQQLLRERQGQ